MVITAVVLLYSKSHVNLWFEIDLWWELWIEAANLFFVIAITLSSVVYKPLHLNLKPLPEPLELNLIGMFI